MKHVLKEAGVSRTSWVDWVNGEKGCRAGNIPVSALIAIANILRMPLKFMFKDENDGTDVIPSYKELFLDRNTFKPNRFDYKRFAESFGKESAVGLSVETMLSRLNASWSLYVQWIGKNPIIRMGYLFSFCEEFGYRLFDYIIDPNPIGAVCMEDDSYPAPSTEELLKEIDNLKKKFAGAQSTNRRLKKDNEALQHDNIRLTGEVIELAHANELLRQRVKNLEAKPYGVDLDSDMIRLAAERNGKDDGNDKDSLG